MYLGTGDFLQESQMAHLFQEGLLGVFPLFCAAAALAEDDSLAEDTCSGPCRQKTPLGGVVSPSQQGYPGRCSSPKLDHLGLRGLPVMLPWRRESQNHWISADCGWAEQ